MDLRSSEDERQAFLAGVHIGVISIERQDGPPLTVPIWYGYERGGNVWVTTGTDSLKTQAAAQGAALQPLRADRRGAVLLVCERRRAGRVGRADGRRRRWPAHGPPLLRRRARRHVHREHQGRGVPHLDHASPTLVVG